MRLSAFLLVCSLLGVLGGAFLIAPWAVGCAVIFDSLCIGGWALFHHYDERAVPQVHDVPLTVPQILERARAAP